MNETVPTPPAGLIHLYRGELGRLTMYRVRLDTTTNWALGAGVAVMTFTLGQPEAPHLVLLLPYVLTVCFAVVESRRYQELDMIRSRVRLLERGMFAPMLGADPLSEDDWSTPLYRSLREPQQPMRLWTALAHRTRRNYFWIFLTLYGAWWLKVWLTVGTISDAARVGAAPGPAVIAVSAALFLPWALLAFWPARRP